jgi:predicted dehydrogenase
VLGLGGAYEKHGLDPQEEQLASGMLPGDPAYGVERAQRWGALVRGSEREPVPTEPGDYPRFYADLATAIETASAPPVAVEDTILVLEVLEAARRSSVSGTVIELAR